MAEQEIVTFLINRQLKPTFLEDTVTILQKDYTEDGAYCSKYLRKNAVCTIIACPISEYHITIRISYYHKRKRKKAHKSKRNIICI